MAQEIALAFRLRDYLSGPLQNLKRNLMGFQGDLEEKMGGVGFSPLQKRLAGGGAAITAVGAALTMGLTRPLMTLGREVVRTSADFESAMDEVKGFAFDAVSTIGKSTEQIATEARANMARLEADVGRLRKRITTEIAPGALFSETEFARAASKLAAAGFRPDAIGGMLPSAATAATALQASLEEAADGISMATSAFGYSKEDAGAFRGFSALYGLVAARTRADLATLTEAFKYSGAVAARTGFSKEGVGASAGFLSNAGLQGSEIGTGLKAMMAQVSKWFSSAGPDEADLRVFRKYGIRRGDFMKTENGETKRKDLDEILEMLMRKKVSADDFTSVFDLEHFGKALTLQSSLKDVQALKMELREAFAAAARGGRTAVDDMAQLMGRGFNAQTKRLSNAWEGLKRAVGDSGLLGLLTGLVERLTGAIYALRGINSDLLLWLTTLGALAAVLGPLAAAAGGIMLAIAFLGPVFAGLGVSVGGLALAMASAVGAFLALGTALFLGIKNWDGIKAWVVDLWTGAKDAAVQGFQTAKGALVGFAVDLSTTLVEAATGLWQRVSERLRIVFGLGRIAEKWSGVSLGLSALADKVSPYLATPATAISSEAPKSASAPLVGPRMTEALARPSDSLSARLSVDFRNAPVGTRVRAEAPRGVELDTRLGIAGGVP